MSIPVSFVFFAGLNGQYLEWGPVIDGTTDNLTPPTYLNTLTGTATLYDSTGTPVTGFNANRFSAESALREGHQEAQLAYGGDFGGVARLDYEPLLFSACFCRYASNSFLSILPSLLVSIWSNTAS